VKSEFCKEALQKFSGCDNTDSEAGTPENPAIWLLGIEHGTFNSIHVALQTAGELAKCFLEGR
jgi:hypothetical protein